MDKTVNFAVFKEKIIKTDELLSIVLEKNRTLDKTQKWTQQLRTKLELSKNEINKLKLKNETLAFNSKKYETLKTEHDKLKEQFNQLEKESSSTINSLQMNYQFVNQELNECKEKLNSLEIEKTDKPLDIKKSPKNRKRKKDEETENEKSVCFATQLKQLKEEKEKLFTQSSNFKLEIYELKKQLSDLKHLENNFQEFRAAKNQLKLTKKELEELKIQFDYSIQEKENQLEQLCIKVESLEVEKGALQAEIEKLKQENASYRLEIAVLHDEKSQNDKDRESIADLGTVQETSLGPDHFQGHSNISENRKTPMDEEVCQIMQQMVMPSRISPFDGTLTPIGCIHPSNDIPFSPPSNNRNKRSSFSPNLDLEKIVNRRRMMKRKRLREKKKNEQVDLLRALIAMKNANINFIISNESLTRTENENKNFSLKSRPIKLSKKSSDKKSGTFTNELKCPLMCCTNSNSYMLFRDTGGEVSPLLGFFDVKNEIKSQQKFNVDSFLMPKLSNKSGKKRKKVENNSENDVEINDKYKKRKARKNSIVEVVESENEEIDCEIEELGVQEKEERIEVCEEQINENRKICDNRAYIRRKPKTRSILSVIKKRRAPLSQNNKIPKPTVKITKDKYLVEKSEKNIPKTSLKKLSNEPTSDITETENQRHFENQTEEKNSADIFKIHEENPKFQEEIIFKKPILPPKTPKTPFKRPICSTRRSPRFAESESDTTVSNQNETIAEIEESPKSTEVQIEESPKSPNATSSGEDFSDSRPVLIPLEKAPERVDKMATSKIEMLFNKLILYSKEEEASNEVVREFASQDPDYVAEAILERVAVDYHDAPDTKYHPAPLMTDVQRTMLGFMSKLEKTTARGVFDSYLTLAEERLLISQNLQEMGPITRLYLAICKHQRNLTRMRKLVCDVFYFCGDLAVPFLFIVLTSWTEVLPHESDSKNMPIAKVLVQIIYMKDCNKPGYNLLPLRDLLIKFYGYPTERWDENAFFVELFHNYLRKPVKSSEFGLLLYCKNRPEKWVYGQIEAHLKPIVEKDVTENFKACLVIMIGNLYNRFSSKSEINYLPKIRAWFGSLVKDTTPDIVRRSVYLCLNRLKKK